MTTFTIPSFLETSPSTSGLTLISKSTGQILGWVKNNTLVFPQHYSYILPSQPLTFNYPSDLTKLLDLYTPILQYLDL